MALKRARDDGSISRIALALGYPILAVGYVLDFCVNISILSLIVLDLPRETTVSKHLSRLQKTGKPFQVAIANWIGKNLLDAFDPSGAHL